jgi:hypothetical protein
VHDSLAEPKIKFEDNLLPHKPLRLRNINYYGMVPNKS